MRNRTVLVSSVFTLDNDLATLSSLGLIVIGIALYYMAVDN